MSKWTNTKIGKGRLETVPRYGHIYQAIPKTLQRKDKTRCIIQSEIGYVGINECVHAIDCRRDLFQVSHVLE